MSRRGESTPWVRSRGRGNRGRGSNAVRGTTRSEGGPRQMELIASVSRSSGLEKGGDALKDFRTQEEYRVFIQGKLDGLWRKHPRGQSETDKESLNRQATQDNILILFRKLREGLVASKRRDQFAVEVYETSSYLAVLFDSALQTTSTLSHLIPDLYSTSTSHNTRITTLISLLHHLIAAYPSQNTFRQHLSSVPSSFLPPDSKAREWVEGVAFSLRSLNYSKFEQLTRLSSFSGFLDPPSELTNNFESTRTLAHDALYHLVDALRTKSREKTWKVIRSAYRELAPESKTTRDWLERSLVLCTVKPGGQDVVLDTWLAKKGEEGQLKKKEGASDGRWIVCKVK